MVAYGFQPPLFPSQEQEVAVPLVKAHLRRCHQVWRHAGAALSCSGIGSWQVPAPDWGEEQCNMSGQMLLFLVLFPVLLFLLVLD